MNSRARKTRRAAIVLFVAAAAIALPAASAWSWGARADPSALPTLPAVRAAGMRVDTLFLGGYAQGSFSAAVQTLASGLSEAEKTLVGRHLDRIFAHAFDGELERGGRLRLAYERTGRPDGTARALRVLAAEAAVAGRLHTALVFEHEGRTGYFDPFGRSLDAGDWVPPLPRLRVTSPFRSQRMHPIHARVLPHLGIDYAAAEGTPVRAVADGIVSFAGWHSGYGRLIEIQHADGYATRYGHLAGYATDIQPGAPTSGGQVIGFVGTSGLATGPHLHFEVRHLGRPVDPDLASRRLPASELPFSVAWSTERRQLTQLLARAPRSLQP